MSQADPSAEIQVLSDTFAVNSTIVAALALLIYDTLLTLPSEIKHIWYKTVKIGTILYLSARYLPMVFILMEIFGSLSTLSLEKCNTLTHLTDALTVPCLIGVQGILLARTYAISLQNQRVLGVLGLLILGAIIIGVYLPVLDNCHPTSSQLNTITLLLTISNVTVILFDTGVVIVTMLSSIQTLRLWRKGEIWDKKSLISLVMYQGFVRYGFVLTISLANAITTEVLRSSLQAILGYFQNSLSVIIICRFHLTLKERHSQLNSPSLPSLSFTSFRAARQSVHDAIVAEFGNPHLSREDFKADNLEDNVVDQEGQQSPEEAGSAGIELDEFPCTTGCPGDVELAGQIASGSR